MELNLEMNPGSMNYHTSRKRYEATPGIESGGTLVIPVRKAMRRYLAAHLRIFEDGEVRHFETVE